MTTFSGSLQRKGRHYYLVTSINGKQKWYALKTDQLRIARIRAAQLVPPEISSENAWLHHLIQLGKIAQQHLDAEDRAQVSWSSLWSAFQMQTTRPIPPPSAESYRRWLDILAEYAPASRPPAALTADDAQDIVRRLATRYASLPRLVVFFRRVWHTMKWDPAIWSRETCRISTHALTLPHYYYRRFETDEVRRFFNYFASQHDNPAAQAYADMIILGYYTGLRLSDIAQLARDEIVSGGKFLSLIPNKTRHIKKRPLRIPLTLPAQTCVLRRLSTASPDGFLFPIAFRRRPTQPLCRALRLCGIKSHDNARVGFHSLRATFISLMDEAGIPPHITDAITGHGGGGMHARYTQPSDKALKAAIIRAIPPLDFKPRFS